MSESKRDAKQWQKMWCTEDLGRKNTVLAKIAFLESTETGRDGATKIMRLNEFLCESMVGLLAHEYVSPKIPHVISTHDAWISDATGFVLQEYAGKSLYKNMTDLTLKEFQSIILQSLIALSVCQDNIHLKHHDLHLENVFINRIKDEDTYGSFKGSTIKANDRWSYKLNGSKGPVCIEFEHCGILAKIGDFGLASATDPKTKTRYERVDYGLLDACEAEWGQWSGGLENVKSYDAVVLLSKFFLDEETELCSEANVAWARSLYAGIMKHVQMECSLIGRPLRGREGSMCIADILALSVFDSWRPSDASAVKMYWPDSVSAPVDLEMD